MARRPEPTTAAAIAPPTSSSSTSTAAASSSATHTPSEPLRKRKRAGQQQQDQKDDTMVGLEENPEGATSWAGRNQWIVLAIASGACAAFNGVFAKLTTNNLTSDISRALTKTFGLGAMEGVIELIFRGIFFGLNLVFNGVMWTLFTKALARGNSTTQVSIMNTSTNFMITALLGLMIFSESLPPLWWVGAAMLVAGNVIIGRKDEGGDDAAAGADDTASSGAEPGTGNVSNYGTAAPATAAGVAPEKDDDEEDVPLLGDLEDERHE